MSKKVKLENELDFEKYKQLHNVVLSFSQNSMEIKKLCITVLIGMPAIINLTKYKVNACNIGVLSFIFCIIVFLFYILDVYTYYYQKKIRINMKCIENDMKERYEITVNKKEIEDERKNLILKSFFNMSHLIYILLIGIIYLISSIWKVILCNF